MRDQPLDEIQIRDLLLRCVIGINDWERDIKQDVLINVTLYADLSAACASDHITDTIDYFTLCERISAHVEGSEHLLVEAMAEHLAGLCLEDPRVVRCRVSVEKPGALRFAQSVGVAIHRSRD
ncbi:dihydroneopterin aldolase [Magnetofaba australis]|uniref:7,8-dihydroneopterin aldolase n=1 Tax=Magnetofaba australis IT-1 TaxID=1434232 RepID=A0A1Y2K1M2_9PROT|nr:dihydroneopterin aldolase [Magnetofaba australis]OSM00082.1 putative dihydroneopterin aldolase [Magnetofaba australis IT-1]